jgi:hypothetical protein
MADMNPKTTAATWGSTKHLNHQVGANVMYKSGTVSWKEDESDRLSFQNDAIYGARASANADDPASDTADAPPAAANDVLLLPFNSRSSTYGWGT